MNSYLPVMARPGWKCREAAYVSRENNALRLFLDHKTVNRVLPMVLASNRVVEENVDATVALIRICPPDCDAATIAAPQLRRLNNNFDTIVSHVRHRDGEVVLFLADAVKVMFRDSDNTRRALAACLAIRQDLAAEARAHSPDAPCPHGVSIGMGCGPVTCGGVGSPSNRHMAYTPMGPVGARGPRPGRDGRSLFYRRQLGSARSTR